MLARTVSKVNEFVPSARLPKLPSGSSVQYSSVSFPRFKVYEEIAEGSDEVDLNGRKVNTRAYCSWYNFKSTDQNKKVGMLSGGERNRLHLAKTLKQSGNLLLL